MNDKNFDQQLGQALKHLDVPYDPATWALLERRLDATGTAPAPGDDPVDQVVFRALDGLEASFQPAHWDLLDKRLQQQAVQVRRLRIAKFAEAAIFLLLLANVGLLLDRKSVAPPPVHFQHHPDVPVADAMPGSRKALGQNTASPESGRQQVTPLSWLTNTTSGASGLPLEVGSTSILGAGYRTDATLAVTLEKLIDVAGSPAKPVYAGIPAADLLPNAARAGLAAHDRPLAWPAAPIQPFRQPKPVYVATFASVNQGRVNINGHARRADGYGGGIAVGFRGEKWGMETGVGYGQTKYVPEPQLEIYNSTPSGYFGSILTEIGSDMITVPVKVSRRVARVGKTTAHAVAGVTAHFAAAKNFDHGTVFYPDPLPNALPTNNQKPKHRANGRGVLEGGRLNDNFFASVDAGVRIEHPIAGGRYKAFVEPVYRQNISGKGVGPKREPVNSFVLQAGVMAFL